MQDFTYSGLFDTDRSLDRRNKHNIGLSDRAWQYLSRNGNAGQAIEIMVLEEITGMFTLGFSVELKNGNLNTSLNAMIRPEKIMADIGKIIKAFKEGKKGYQVDDFSEGIQALNALLEEQYIPISVLKLYGNSLHRL